MDGTRRQIAAVRTAAEHEGGRAEAAIARCVELEASLAAAGSRLESATATSREADSRAQQLAQEIRAASRAQSQRVLRLCSSLCAQLPASDDEDVALAESGDGGLDLAVSAARIEEVAKLRELRATLEAIADEATGSDSSHDSAPPATTVQVVHRLQAMATAQSNLLDMLLKVRVLCGVVLIASGPPHVHVSRHEAHRRAT